MFAKRNTLMEYTGFERTAVKIECQTVSALLLALESELGSVPTLFLIQQLTMKSYQ
jgi:hypothetical protein